MAQPASPLWWRALKVALAGLVAVLLLLIVAGLALDTAPGRRFVADRIAAMRPDNGLVIHIGRIEGSLYSRTRLRDVRLSDPQGRFATIAEAELDWAPWRYLVGSTLSIDRLVIPRAELVRLPRLRDTGNDRILPDFDLDIRSVRIERIDYGPLIAGAQRSGTLTGHAVVKSGVLRLSLDAAVRGSGDRLRLRAQGEPERRQFDLDGELVAPGDGVFAALLGLDRPTALLLQGAGDWRDWRGVLLARSGGADAGRLRLRFADGQLGVTGTILPDRLVAGLPPALAGGEVAVDAQGRVTDRRWDGRIALVGQALRIDARGVADVGNRRWQAMRIDAWVRDGNALATGLSGQNATASLLLDGDWATPRYEYRILASRLGIGAVTLGDVRASGNGLLARRDAAVPVDLAIARITGIAPALDPRLAGLRLSGAIARGNGGWEARGLTVRSAGLDTRIDGRFDNRTGMANARLTGSLSGVDLNRTGLVDLGFDVALARSAQGGVTANGRARGQFRRFDNAFLRTLAGGLPLLDATIALGSDRVLRLPSLRITSPLLSLSGAGSVRGDGTLALNGRGQHRRYGAFGVDLTGPIARPRIALALAQPVPAAGVRDVRLLLDPDPAGFALTASGQSLIGPFDGTGRLLLPPGGVAQLDVTRLTISDTQVRGRLAITGGLVGQLLVSGGGVDGRIVLTVPGGVQRLAADLDLRNAGFAGAGLTRVARGQVTANLLFDPRGFGADATFELTGVTYGNLGISRLAGSARLTGGVGTVRASMAGERGRDIGFQAVASVTNDSVTLRGQGRVAGRTVTLGRPAVFSRDGDGWTLAPVDLLYAGGEARVSGHIGDRLRIDAGFDNLPLSLADLVMADAGLAGRASGRLSYDEGGGVPTGSVQLRINGFNRSGLYGLSEPVDLALNATLSGNSAGARGVATRDGATVGRAQIHLAPLPAGATLIDRLTAAPMVAQLRYSGDAERLWRLAGVEGLAIAGPVAIAADVGGSLRAPVIRGTVRANGARVESGQTGTVVTNVMAQGRFDGARLLLTSVSGDTRGGGTISGSGSVSLSAAEGFPLDLRLQADRALLIDRDDLVARVTGPLTISRGADGNRISGRFMLDSGRFALGRATAVDALPVINVVETNAPADRPQPRQRTRPWQLDLAITGRSDFTVTGLGLESLWSTDIAVRGDAANFGIFGSAELVRGDYVFAGRRFALERGTIRFDGSSPANPALDIVAVDDISGIDATIRVRGTGLRPEISFTSVPALPEDELLSRILFGSSITEISATEAAQLALAVAALRDGGGGLDPINALRRATGLDRLRILPADTALGTSTAIAAGKYVTRRVFVEVITDGRGYSATRVEYQITRWLAVLGSISTIGRESVNVRIQRDY